MKLFLIFFLSIFNINAAVSDHAKIIGVSTGKIDKGILQIRDIHDQIIGIDYKKYKKRLPHTNKNDVIYLYVDPKDIKMIKKLKRKQGVLTSFK